MLITANLFNHAGLGGLLMIEGSAPASGAEWRRVARKHVRARVTAGFFVIQIPKVPSEGLSIPVPNRAVWGEDRSTPRSWLVAIGGTISLHKL